MRKLRKERASFYRCLVFLLFFINQSIALPILPKEFDWQPDCKLVISEIKLNFLLPLTENGQFVELTVVCQTKMTHNREVQMARFHLVFFDGVTEELLMTCHLKGPSTARGLSENPEHYFVVGSKGVSNANMHFSDCQSALATPDSLPLGRGNPVGVALLKLDVVRGASMDPIKLESDGKGRFKPKKMLKWLVDKITPRVRDFYVYATTAPSMSCEFFNDFYRATQQHTILRSLEIQDPQFIYSLNRCTLDSNSHHNNFLLAPPSPGEKNKCEEGFNFDISQHITRITSTKQPLSLSLPQNRPMRAQNIESRCTYTDFSPLLLNNLNENAIKAVFKELQVLAQEKAEEIKLPPPSAKLPKPPPQSTSGAQSSSASSSTSQNRPASTPNEPEQTQSADTLPPATFATALVSHGISSSVPEPSRPFPGRKNIWENCNPFNPVWKADIIQRYSHAISIDEILQKEICWWLQYSPNPVDKSKSIFYCKICNELKNKPAFVKERPSSKWWTGAASKEKSFLKLVLGPGENKNLKNENSKNLQNHLQNPLHKIAEQLARAQDLKLQGIQLQKFMENEDGAFRKFYKATETLFSAVYTAVKMRISFSAFKTFSDFLESTTAKIGSLYHNADGMKTIVKFIADRMKRDLFEYFKTKKPKVSVVLDSSVDVSGEHNLVVLFFYVDESFNLRTRLYKYIPLSGSSADEIFKAFSKNIEADGLKEWLMESMVGYTSDGAAVMKNTLKDLIVDWLKINLQGDERSNFFPCWCAAHRLELTMKHAMKIFEYMKHIDVILNELYKFFNNVNLKNREALKEMIIELEDTFFTLKKLYQIRWIANKQRGTATILKHFETIAKTLLKIATDGENYLLPTVNQAQFLYDQIRDPVFLSHLAWLADLVDVYTIASKAFQRKDVTIIDQKHVIDKLNDDLDRLEEGNGNHLSKLLSETECDGDLGCDLEDFESEGARLNYYGTSLERLPNSRKVPQKPLSMARKEYVAQLHIELLNYFQPTTEQNFEVFHPSQLEFFSSSTKSVRIVMPDGKITVKPGTEFASEALLRLNRWFVWSPRKQGVATIMPEYLALIKSIIQKPDFQQMKSKTAHEFWRHYFINQEGIPWTEKMKEAVRTGLAVSAVSSSAERYFSLYNQIKTIQRFNLKPSLVEDLVRICHEQDLDIDSFNALRYAIEWSGIRTRSDDSGNVPGTKIAPPQSSGQTCSRRREPVELPIEAQLRIDDDEWITSPFDKLIAYQKAISGELQEQC